VAETTIVLVVEDEVLLHDVMEAALSDAGYSTTFAVSGDEAIATLESEGETLRALVTDVNLSGALTGWDVARRAREIAPALPVIYMTGDSGHEWPSQGVPNSALLVKPFAAAQLVTAVSTLLLEADARRAMDAPAGGNDG